MPSSLVVKKGSKILSMIDFGIPPPCIPDGRYQHPVRYPGFNPQLSPLRHSLYGVEDEVEEELAQDHLRQLFLNLILNAIQAMPQGGELRIKTRISDGVLITTIRDTGGGDTEIYHG